MPHLKRLIYRGVGPPPGPGAIRAERLRWVRRFYRLNFGALVIVAINAALDGSTFLWILDAACGIWWVCGVTTISLSVRREEARHG